MFYGIIECSIKCPRCENPIFLDGPLRKVHCNNCQSIIDISAEYWTGILKDLSNEIITGELAEGEGQNSTIFGEFNTSLMYGRLEPYCYECKTDFEINENMSEPYTHTCTGCGNKIEVAFAPEWLSKELSSAYIVYNAILIESDEPEISAVSGPIAFTCQQCGGALIIDGKERLLPCQFCGVNVYLPDDLWLRLHPAKTKRRWGVGFRSPGEKLGGGRPDPASAIPQVDDENLALSGQAWQLHGLLLNGARGLDSGKHPKGKVAWKLRLGNTGYRNSMALVNNKLYIPSGNPYDGDTDVVGLWCVDATTGEVIWRYDTTLIESDEDDAECLSGVVVWDGKCYFGSENNFLYCLSADTGELIHKLNVGYSVDSAPTISNGRLYLSHPDDYLLCLNATTFEELFKIEYEPLDTISPIVKDNGVYFAGSYELFCIDAISGMSIWKVEIDESVNSQIILSDNFLYYADDYNTIICRGISDGEVVWEFKGENGINSTPVVVNNRLYFGNRDEFFFCLNATTGEKIWEYAGEYDIDSSPAVADGRVYFGDDDGKLYCADATTGKIHWKRNNEENIAAPIIVIGGRVYYHSQEGVLYCFE